jgi:hypothetical protein
MGDITGRKPRVSRAVRKKMRRRFKVGNMVTWGLKVVANRVVEVTDDGLLVDASKDGCRNPRYFVAWSDEPEVVR